MTDHDASSPASGSRSFRGTVALAADRDAVWRALTDATELTRWFAPEARIERRVGGAAEWRWGDAFAWPLTVERFDEGTHVRYAYDSETTTADGTRRRLAVDFHLEGDGGRTTLRVVHSGFGPEADWDQELEGVAHGWTAELRGLRHYLERHRGQPRRLAWAWRRVDDPAAAWARLVGRDGLVADGALAGEPGAPWRARLRTGDELSGEVWIVRPGREFVGTAREWNDAVLRVWSETCGGKAAVWLYVSTWGVDQARVAALQQRLDAELTRLFPTEVPAR